MPTYPYACTECGHAFEVQQSFTDPALTQCPECSGRLRKVFSSVGVVFKGSGFYRTDSRSGSKSSSSASSDGAKSDGKKSDAKPAAKSDGGTTSSSTSSSKPTSTAAAGS